jgi:anti-sigma factor ChrR (cupin superfamily)
VSPINPTSLLPPDLASLRFQELRDGVEIHVLHEAPDSSRVAILRYRPGAEVPPHRHEGYEYIYVLEGEQSDERGSYGAGSFVVNEPGLSHRVSSKTGCVVLIIWQRPVVFL